MRFGVVRLAEVSLAEMSLGIERLRVVNLAEVILNTD